MNKFVVSLGLFLAFVSLSCSPYQSNDKIKSNSPSSLQKSKEDEVTPRLLMKPSFIFDVAACQYSDFKINPERLSEVHLELSERLDTFQGQWDENAKALILQSEKVAGVKFERKEYSVGLSGCGITPMAPPIFIVSVLPYLSPPKLVNGVNYPLSMDAFVSMVHHELLHPLFETLVLSQKFWLSSKLLQKYQNEADNVKVHLHLMAVQKMVYLNLDEDSLIEASDQLYKSIDGDYLRAWNIIEDEGAEIFAEEARVFYSN